MDGSAKYTGTTSRASGFARFHATQDGYAPIAGRHHEFRVNNTIAGNQAYPTVAMDAHGDYVVVWSGDGARRRPGRLLQDLQGYRPTPPARCDRFRRCPTEPRSATTTRSPSPLYAVILDFDEALDPTTATNISNYALLLNGVQVVGGIAAAYYTGRDTA